ncbi:MAG: glycoside hydrolase family 18 protein [Bacilli bacterium]
MKHIFLLVAFLFMTTGCSQNHTSAPVNKQVIVYAPMWKEIQLLTPAPNVTIVNLAFATLTVDGLLDVTHWGNDAEIKSKLQTLRTTFPNAKFLLSVGGEGVDGFSQMTQTPSSRQQFLQSVMAHLELYNLDGVDYDWEFPVQGGWGSISASPNDTVQFTALIQETRAVFNAAEKERNGPLFLSYAAGAYDWAVQYVDVKTVADYVNWINLMSYHYTGTYSNTPGHSAPLYNEGLSVHNSVRYYLDAGVPPEKMMIGIPLYGAAWQSAIRTSDETHPFAPNARPMPELLITQATLPDLLVRFPNLSLEWDADAMSAYYYNGDVMITIETERSLQEKVRYVDAHQFGGLMFWEYTQDDNLKMIRTVPSQNTIQSKK